MTLPNTWVILDDRMMSQNKGESRQKPRPSGSRPSKLLSLSQASRWAANAHRRGLRIVATNGCFDLIHFGHVSYLQRARKLGNLLVVGLNSDRSVRQLKGPHRPLAPQRARAAVLAALECVDAVVVFNEKRAHRFLAAVKPDVYVKGGDYRPDSLAAEERAVLTAIGATTRIVPFVKGYSTSSLVKKIRAMPARLQARL